MLNALLGSGVGDVAAVVTRYFGGIKLGTGGLARTYAACVKEAMAALPVIERVPMVELRFVASYAGARELERLLDEAGAVVLEKSYGAEVLLRVSVPLDRDAGLRQVLGGLHGMVRIEPHDPPESA
jgi:putative IMPACT (imprinted ancient) family translation regulator